jgi:hypothetical protein
MISCLLRFFSLGLISQLWKVASQQEVYGLEREVVTSPLGDGMADMANNYYVTYNDTPMAANFNLATSQVVSTYAFTEAIDKCIHLRWTGGVLYAVCVTPAKTGGIHNLYVMTTAFSLTTSNSMYPRLVHFRTFTLASNVKYTPIPTKQPLIFFMVSTERVGTSTKLYFAEIKISSSSIAIGFNTNSAPLTISGEFLVGPFTRADYVNTAEATVPKLFLMNAHKTTEPFSTQKQNNNMLIIYLTNILLGAKILIPHNGVLIPDFLYDFQVFDGDRFQMTGCYNRVGNQCQPYYSIISISESNWVLNVNPFVFHYGPFPLKGTAGQTLNLESTSAFWPLRMLRALGDTVLGLLFLDSTVAGTSTIYFKTLAESNSTMLVVSQVILDSTFSIHSHRTPVHAGSQDYFPVLFSSSTYHTAIRITDAIRRDHLLCQCKFIQKLDY